MTTLYKKKTPLYTIEETKYGTFKITNNDGFGWRISKQEVKLNRIFDKNWHPEPSQCWKCKKLAMFKLGSTPVAEELVLIHYGCVACEHFEKRAT